MKILSGSLKILYPNGILTKNELEEIISLSCELRQRVRNQLYRIAPGEYERVKLSGKMLKTNLDCNPETS